MIALQREPAMPTCKRPPFNNDHKNRMQNVTFAQSSLQASLDIVISSTANTIYHQQSNCRLKSTHSLPIRRPKLCGAMRCHMHVMRVGKSPNGWQPGIRTNRSCLLRTMQATARQRSRLHTATTAVVNMQKSKEDPSITEPGRTSFQTNGIPSQPSYYFFPSHAFLSCTCLRDFKLHKSQVSLPPIFHHHPCTHVNNPSLTSNGLWGSTARAALL